MARLEDFCGGCDAIAPRDADPESFIVTFRAAKSFTLVLLPASIINNAVIPIEVSDVIWAEGF